jgi:hypothetical protein
MLKTVRLIIIQRNHKLTFPKEWRRQNMKRKSKKTKPIYDLEKIVKQDIDNNPEYDYPRMVFGEHIYKLLNIEFKDKICFLDIEPIEGGDVISCNTSIWQDTIFYEEFFCGRMCLVFDRKLNPNDDIYR